MDRDDALHASGIGGDDFLEQCALAGCQIDARNLQRQSASAHQHALAVIDEAGDKFVRLYVEIQLVRLASIDRKEPAFMLRVAREKELAIRRGETCKHTLGSDWPRCSSR